MVRALPLPSVSVVAEKFEYNPETGKFYHRRTLPNGVQAGTEAGMIGTNGYLRLKIAGRELLAHRIAWLLFYGEEPSMFIDHINGQKSDNRIANLRLATIEQNGWNRGKAPTNKSGYKGVSWNCGRWHVALRIGRGKILNVGRFKSAEVAHQKYVEAVKKFHGEFAKW